LTALSVSAAAFVYVTFIYTQSTATFADGREVLETRSTLWQDEGLGIYLVYHMLPGLLSLICLVAFLSKRATLTRIALWTSSVIISLLGLVTIFSIGILYIPVGVLLAAAAVTYSFGPEGPADQNPVYAGRPRH
jgi:hypothetical protein